jgi:predicted phage tail protein
MAESRYDKEGGWEIVLSGSGGGGGGGGGKKGGRKPQEDPESLRSRSEATVVGVISEGEVFGFEPGVDPLNKIFLDGTPIKNVDGSFNYGVATFFTGSAATANGKGNLLPAISQSIPGLQRGTITGQVNSLVIDYRVGTQNQDPMPGFDDVKAEQSVGLRLARASGPISRTTLASNFNRIRIRVGIGALFFIDKETGDVKGRTVSFNVKIRPIGGSNFVNENISITGKSRGPVDFEYEYRLVGTGPWVVTLERLTEDPTSTSVSDDLFFKGIVGIIDRSFRYPNSCLIGLKIGAENFTAVPTLAAEMLGVKVKIPSNYNPFTRQYSGVWDGTFQTNWTNNPAWIFYDLLTNTRYGAGEFIDESQVDRYSLLPIAQYCDELVPDGRGGLEPRMTFNAYITDRGDAYEVLNALAASFRGLTYFAEGTIVAIQDRPKNVTKIFSPANVIQEVDDGGEITGAPFVYEGSARKARKTVALVSWNDPLDNYKEKIEYVEDVTGVARYGIQELEVRAMGTTSQGQAQRIGRWMLLTNQLETSTVSFKVATEGNFILPGEIIGIADPARQGKRFGGRVVDATTSAITIDAPFSFIAGKSYSLTVTLESGAVQSRTVTNGEGEASVVTISPPLSSAPLPGGMWVLQEDGEGYELYRVGAINEDTGELTVFATEYDPSKFTETDQGTILGANRASVAGPQIVPSVNRGSIVLEVNQ